jgi:hypothetical protein
MRVLTAYIFLLGSFVSMPVMAQQQPTMPSANPFQKGDVSIYAYQGRACPKGSELYKGPEQQLAAESGAVYCRFTRTVTLFYKKEAKRCPAGMKLYSDRGFKPDANSDVIGCVPDVANPSVIPPLPAQPDLSGPPAAGPQTP